MRQCVKLVSENYLFLMTKPTEKPSLQCVCFTHGVWSVRESFHVLVPFIKSVYRAKVDADIELFYASQSI